MLRVMDRQIVLPRIKEQRKSVFRSIIRQDANETENQRLTPKDFIIICTMYNMNMNYLCIFIELVMNNGAILVCVFYLILTALLGMPLTMLFIFISSYSRKSYLAIWDCAPLLEGIGYSMAILRFTSECYNVMIAAVSLNFIGDIIEGSLKKALYTCSFKMNGVTSWHVQNGCIPMESRLVANCTTHSTFTALQYYYRFILHRYTYTSDWETPVVNVHILATTAFVWLLIFTLSILGLQRLKKVTVTLQLVFACFMAIVATTSVSKIEFSLHRWQYSKSTKMSMKFWVEIILHASETTVLGNLIWLGSIKPDCLDPKYAAIITTPIKLFLLLLVVCTTTISVQENTVQYSFENSECFNVAGSEVLLVLLPDNLFRNEAWRLSTIMWYLSMFYFGALATLYSLIGLVDSITQKFKSLRKYSFLVCLVLCVIGFILTISLSLNITSSIIRGWRYYGSIVLTAALSLLINLAVFFVYSTRKVIDDYIFTYGRPPERYWTSLWKAAPIFTIFAFIFALTFQSTSANSKDSNNVIMWASYLQSASVLLPVMIIFLTRCCRNIKHRTLDTLTRPAPTWGPSSPKAVLDRKGFFPERDIKCRNLKLKCKHKCAVSNQEEHYKEIKRQNAKYKVARDDMARTKETAV